ncbi:MAG: gliding motility-associated C-terminal domain-containing protein, partial [Paludibacteraceae bacterium]|nr:gliding motility-associated C-terminal domain-containing protein [Paludibacteraceae bacterium]
PTLPVVKDNCGNVLTPTATSPVISAIPACEGDVTYTYTYEDCEGNTHDWVYTYHLKDSIKPEINNSLADHTIERCDADLSVVYPAATTVAELEAMGLEISDNCAADEDMKVTSTETSAGYAPIVITRVYTITDNCGNSSEISQIINVIDTTAPVCPSFDTLRLVLAADQAVFDKTQVIDSLVKYQNIYQATDNCDALISGTYSNVLDSYTWQNTNGAGNEKTITWTYADVAGNNTTCQQPVIVVDVTQPECPVMNLDSILILTDAISKADLADSIKAHGIPTTTDANVGVVTGTLAEDMLEDSYMPGVHNITWNFTDGITGVVNCLQQFEIVFVGNPEIDCDTILPVVDTLAGYDCQIAKNDIQIKLPRPVAYENFGKIAIDGQIELPATFGKDTTMLTWTFTDAYGHSVTCPQMVIVRDTTPGDTTGVCLPEPIVAYAGDDCKANVELPALIIHNDCDGDLTGVATRADGLDLDARYEKGATMVTWNFSDASGNMSFCRQNVMVVDTTAPKAECNLPEILAFVNEGCEVKAKDIPFVTPTANDNCDGVVNGQLVDPAETYTVGTFTEKWMFADSEGNASYCNQTIVVKDTLAPVWNDVTASVTISSSDSMPAFPDFTATDNCTEVTYETFDHSTQSTDSSKCEAYTYDIVREYTAQDAYGNVSDTISFTIHVADTIAPVYDYDKAWTDNKYVATTLRHCNYAVPDLITEFAVEEHLSDNSSPFQHIKVWQKPVAGEEMFNSAYVYLYAEDLCGNVDSIAKYVFVPDSKSIVTAFVSVDTICGNDTTNLSLVSNEIRDANGTSWGYEFGEWVEIPSTIVWDVYHDAVAPANLIYSNNDYTYGSKFEKEDGSFDYHLRDSLTLLRRAYQSGLYYFVAMDTLTRCSDTISADLTIHERPRVALDLASVPLCENQPIDLDDMASRFNLCVNDMGEDITSEGWLLDGKPYLKGDKVAYVGDTLRRLTYFATNVCGTSTSDETFYYSCFGSPTTKEDSMKAAGSAEAYKKMRIDSLVMNNYIGIDVHQAIKSSDLLLVTKPQAKARVWKGEEASLILHAQRKPLAIWWYRVTERYDAAGDLAFDKNGEAQGKWGIPEDVDDELIELAAVTPTEDGPYKVTFTPEELSAYYAVVTDSVCPAVSSNVVEIDVVQTLPTAISPYTHDGLNDEFMRGFHVIIFNRYGQKVFEGNDGWDGTYRGILADPGVYFYAVTLRDGTVTKGSIEVVKTEKNDNNGHQKIER